MSASPYPDYRTVAGVSWPEKVPAHWDISKLSHIALLRSGEGITSEEIAEFGQYPVYGGNGTRGYCDRYTHDGEFVLIGRQGALCGNINYAGGKFWASEHAVVVRPLRWFATRWMGELLRAMNLNQHSVSAAQPGLSVATISALRIPVPPVDEQRAIAEFLDRETAKIDSLISAKRRLLRAVDERVSAVVEQLVTKRHGFEALDAPSSVRLKFLLRSIEQGWSPQCDNSAAADGQWGVLKTGCVNGGRFDADENKALPAELEPIPSLEISAGDVLMSRANTKELLGSAAFVEFARPRLLLCDKLYRLRTRPEALDPEFLVLSLGTSLSRHQLERDATGTSASMQNIGQDTVRNLRIPLAALPEQREVVEKARRIRAEARALQQHVLQALDALEEYRTALISAAVTGQIDVRTYRPQEVAVLCQ